ncbi:MAG: cupin domain-containing protein [Thermoanaerobaculia bacterium]|nr:cupin domain-containing protein [Thermoanaerobaculia bacterium]
MRILSTVGVSVLAVLTAFAAPSLAGEEKQGEKEHGKTGHLMVTADQLEWTDVASMPPGAEMAVLEGDPSKEGPFTLRLKVPANYYVPAHVHPAAERVTVLEGTIYMAAGENLDEEDATELGPDSLAVVDEGVPMIGFTRDDPAVFQLNGDGPWGITYLDPDDDPRDESNEDR